ncbi:hypothetical protein ACQKWADRAFT_307001 [Trichoderma austrokoningii]
MALHDQGNTQQNAAELGLSAASPLGKNDEAEHMLAFNLPNLAAETSPATMFQSHPTRTVNMKDISGSQTRLFNSRNEPLLGEYSSLLYQEDLPRRNTSHGGMATNDDTNWLLLGLSTRLENLETAVANGNETVAQLNAQVMVLANDCVKGDEFQQALNNLKKGIKELATAFIDGGLGDSKM